MPFTVTMPKLSPTMEEGTITKWHIAVGDHVEAGQLLFEVATDKATIEYNAIDSGWLKKMMVNEGQSAIVNQAVAVFTEEEKESIEGYQPTGISLEKKVETAVEIAIPEDHNEGDLAPQKKTDRQETIFKQAAFVPEAPLANYHFGRSVVTTEERLRSSPLARKLAKEKGLDLRSITGSGPGNRIVSKDLELAQAGNAWVAPRGEMPQHAPGTYEEEPLSPLRKVIGQRLQESKTFIPHFYIDQVVDAKALLSLREQLQQMDFKYSINDLLIKACAIALKRHPNINAGFNSVNQTVIAYKTIDISVAVSVNGGLITPIVRYADYKTVGEISVEVRSLAKRAKEGKLESFEYKGGSFTISNLGMYGVTSFQAIINPPQAAILAVSGVQEVPVVKTGQIVPGKVMHLTLSCDHRVIDGVAAAEFMKTLQKVVENPAVLLV